MELLCFLWSESPRKQDRHVIDKRIFFELPVNDILSPEFRKILRRPLTPLRETEIAKIPTDLHSDSHRGQARSYGEFGNFGCRSGLARD